MRSLRGRVHYHHGVAALAGRRLCPSDQATLRGPLAISSPINPTMRDRRVRSCWAATEAEVEVTCCLFNSAPGCVSYSCVTTI